MTRKRFINTDRFVAALHAHRVAGDGFAPDYFPCAEFRLASPNFLFAASNPAVCKDWRLAEACRQFNSLAPLRSNFEYPVST